MAHVLAITVNYNGGHWVVDAAGSLLSQQYPTDVLVIDNDSSDGSVAAIRHSYPDLRIIETGKNLGSVAGYNYALNYRDYDYYVFLNPDAFAPPSMVGDLVALMDRNPHLAVLGPTIVEYNEPTIIQALAPRNDFLQFPIDEWEGRPVTSLPDVDILPSGYACAAAVMCRADVFRELGGMDDAFFMFTEEPDFSWRARLLGYETCVTPRVRVRHVGGVAAAVGKENGSYVTSLLRIYLRERNSLMMALKCFAFPTLVLYLCALSATASLECLALLALGKREIAQTYWKAMRDAVRALPEILRKRRLIQRGRRVSEQDILKAVAPGYAKLTMLLRRGIPVIRDWRRQAGT